MAVRARSSSFTNLDTQTSAGPVILNRGDVARLLDEETGIKVVRQSLIEQAAGRSLGPTSLALKADGGTVHVKAGGLRLGRTYVAAKINANFPGNPATR